MLIPWQFDPWQPPPSRLSCDKLKTDKTSWPTTSAPQCRTTMCHVFIALHTEKSLRHVAMEAKFPDLNKPWSCKYDTNDFPVHHCTQEQNGNPYFFFHGFDNAKCHLCQERLLRYRNFANMVKWRHASLELIANWHFLHSFAVDLSKFSGKSSLWE